MNTEHNIEDRELVAEAAAERRNTANTITRLTVEALDKLQGRITHVSGAAVTAELFPNKAKFYIHKALAKQVEKTDADVNEKFDAMVNGDQLGGLHNNNTDEIVSKNDAMAQMPDIDKIRDNIAHLDFDPPQNLNDDFPMAA